jgi:DNA-binding response OmpR family regulator
MVAEDTGRACREAVASSEKRKIFAAVGRVREMRILIVEDDAALARGLAGTLKLSGFSVDHEADGAEAAALAVSEPYSLVVLDLGLPNLSGFDVLRQIRRSGSKVPVMILTARDAITDRVKGLDLGADDYLLKPFDVAEFAARVRALVRRGQGLPDPSLTCGPLSLDRAAGVVSLNGEPLILRRRELAVLTGLMTRAGKVVPKERLISEVFGFDEPVAPNALELYVARLRKKLEPEGLQIRTIRGIGYLLEAR